MLIRLAALTLLFAIPLMPQEQKIRRLESVTWNPITDQLSWVVTNGSAGDGGKYVPDPDKRFQYVIDLKEVTMEHEGNKRRFAKEEADNVLMVMQLISRYAQESTVWWEEGKGDPLDSRKEKVKLRVNGPLTPERMAQLIQTGR